jgi:hypothetical protein
MIITSTSQKNDHSQKIDKAIIKASGYDDDLFFKPTKLKRCMKKVGELDDAGKLEEFLNEPVQLLNSRSKKIKKQKKENSTREDCQE